MTGEVHQILHFYFLRHKTGNAKLFPLSSVVIYMALFCYTYCPTQWLQEISYFKFLCTTPSPNPTENVSQDVDHSLDRIL